MDIGSHYHHVINHGDAKIGDNMHDNGDDGDTDGYVSTDLITVKVSGLEIRNFAERNSKLGKNFLHP